jgi:hypothetical protein
MRTVKRPRRYVTPRLIAIGRPVLRYSQPRDAYVLRLVGRKWGPVLRSDRRRPRRLGEAAELRSSTERRGSHARVA